MAELELGWFAGKLGEWEGREGRYWGLLVGLLQLLDRYAASLKVEWREEVLEREAVFPLGEEWQEDLAWGKMTGERRREVDTERLFRRWVCAEPAAVLLAPRGVGSRGWSWPWCGDRERWSGSCWLWLGIFFFFPPCTLR